MNTQSSLQNVKLREAAQKSLRVLKELRELPSDDLWFNRWNDAIEELTAALAQQDTHQWHPLSEPLQYLTRAKNGTIFVNQVIDMPAHVEQWALINHE